MIQPVDGALQVRLASRSSGPTTDSKFIASRDHDFGTVARGSRTFHDFKIKNPFDQPMVIAQARSSCGCTKAKIPDGAIEPGGIGIVKAEFNTRSFIGQKSATLTVVISHPIQKEIQLRVKGNIRGDIVLEPGELIIPSIKLGEKQEVATRIKHIGSPDWAIVDVKSSLGFLAAELDELQRQNGRVDYQLKITMKGDFPPGVYRDQLTLVTNDRNNRRIPISFSARATSPLSVSPQDIVLDVQQIGAGTTVSKKLIFKSDQPFRFTKIESSDQRVQLRVNDQARKAQIATLTFQNIEGVPLPKSISISFETDLGPSYRQKVDLRFVE